MSFASAKPWLMGVGLTAAMLSPVVRRPPTDGFPLSTYPMFAVAHGSTAKVYTVLGITADGDAEVLSPSLISGDPWPSLASRITAAASRSRAKRRGLCETVAARVSADPELASRYVELEFVAETYEIADYFVAGITEASSRRRLAGCPVPR